ncbi:MurR/RpiR family transcriptional regulator [Streptomyces sp. NPDC006733]|uniref:MurR/RpiR family transcriptional regulator n=1 Tax=Streptomyces sp. NPDC006733 TaxID=3155460 RepID=UPI0033EE0147
MPESLDGGPDVLTLIETALPRLPDALRRIGQAILDDPDATATMTVAALGQRSHTSPAGVTRFCRAVGLAGFQDLRLRLAREAGRATAQSWPVDVGFDIAASDDFAQVAAVVARADIMSIQRTVEQLDHTTAEAAAQALATAGRIDIYAFDGSACAATEMEIRMHRIGRPIWARTDGHRAETSAALLGAGDVAIGLSHSGATAEIVSALRTAHAAGAITIAITNDARSPLTTAADHVLTTAVYGTTFRHGGSAARHAQLLLLDCLYVRVAQLTHDHATASLAKTASISDRHRAT